MSNIVIVPIFNQSAPQVWKTFLSIRSAAMRHSCGYQMSTADYEFAMDEMTQGWVKRGFNFAFGAYDGATMIGFVQGDCIENTATIRSLYVRPEYMSQHIGQRLLMAAEQAGSFAASSLDLVSLPRAQKFYEHHDYKPVSHGGNHYIKDITFQMRARCATAPVFKLTRGMHTSCSKISQQYGMTFDASHVNQHHKPMFVYVDAASQVQGYVLGVNNAKTYIAAHQPAELIAKRLKREVDKLKSIRQNQGNIR